jgi:hypothetical protein
VGLIGSYSKEAVADLRVLEAEYLAERRKAREAREEDQPNYLRPLVPRVRCF